MIRICPARHTPWGYQLRVPSKSGLGSFPFRGLPSLAPYRLLSTNASHVWNVDVMSAATSYREQFLRHWAGTEEPQVPSTLSDTLLVFFSHPTAVMVMSALTVLGWIRSSSGATGVDALVVVAVACWWLLQEWVVHKFLLHSPFPWIGRSIHEAHHQKSYFHVTVDSPALVGSVMVVSAVLFMGVCKAHPLGMTATLTYWFMGLLYEFAHYVAHTRYMPKWERMRRVKINHMMHHGRNKDYWLSFLAPEVDSLFGTAPDPKTVPKSKCP